VDNSQHASQLPEQSSSDAPAVNGEASLSLQTGRLAPEMGDVQRSVDVPMMFGTAIAAHPAPDPKTIQPSRTADASTRRTGSGCIRFIGFQIDHPRVIAFVSEVAPQHRPSGIEHALRHPGPCQLGSRHGSDRDPAALVDQPPGKLVQGVLSSVGDRGVDRLDLPITPLALRLRQLWLKIAVEGCLFQFGAIGTGRDCLQAEIDADLVSPAKRLALDRADEVAGPPPVGILRETAGLDPTLDRPVAPP
jgi:hypothetical protein